MRSERSTLLLVDDEPSARRLLADCLHQLEYEVVEVSNGEQALEWIRAEQVDLVLLAIRPHLDGLAVLRAVRLDFPAPQLPVIMLTREGDGDTAVQALKNGANDFLTEPIDLPVAVARIQNHLAFKQTQKALRDSEERFSLAERGSNDGLWQWDLRRGSAHFSARWKTMLGCLEDEITDTPDEWFRRVHPEDVDLLCAELEAHLCGRTSHFEHEYRMLHKDGEYRWMIARGLADRDASGQAFRVAGSQTDMSRARVADWLTGLPNRLLFLDRLERLLMRARRRPTYRFGVIFLDLDGFKSVNDHFGHQAGDEFLVATARRLESCLRATDTVARFGKLHTVARLGGDEFTILLDDISDSAVALKIAERISFEICQPVMIGDREVATSASMGIAISSSAYQKPEELLNDADTAMYRAKMLGKNRIALFENDVPARACSA